MARADPIDRALAGAARRPRKVNQVKPLGTLLPLLLSLLAAPVSEAQTPKPPQSKMGSACQDDPNYHLQDFAVGSWDVYAGEKRTAEVRLEWVLGGCAINEVWTPADPGGKGHGRGLFTYSKLLKAWHYYWAADGGTTTYFTSAPSKPGEILYVTTLTTAAGKLRRRHWTLTAQSDGGVRELSLATEDNGQTWSTEYDLSWRRKP